jgi:hypothetical protein
MYTPLYIVRAIDLCLSVTHPPGIGLGRLADNGAMGRCYRSWTRSNTTKKREGILNLEQELHRALYA